MTDVELLPCPCGAPAAIFPTTGRGTGPREKLVVVCTDPDCPWSMTGYGPEQVAERWNRRSTAGQIAVKLQPAAVDEATIKRAAMACARRAYGYYRGGDSGSYEALAYFDDGLGASGRANLASNMESELRAALGTQKVGKS